MEIPLLPLPPLLPFLIRKALPFSMMKEQKELTAIIEPEDDVDVASRRIEAFLIVFKDLFT